MASDALPGPSLDTVASPSAIGGIRKTISVVTPCYNEERGIEECVNAVASIFAERLPGYRLEHVICDNASTDRTVKILRRLAAQHPHLRVILNTRNFGIFRNVYNGVLAASGDAVVLLLPADMQDPPDLIPEMVRLWSDGYEVVYGLRARREEPLLLRSARKAYYRLLSRLSYVEYPPDAGDFQLVDRKVLEVMRQYGDAEPFMRMMTFDSGFRSIGIKYTWKARVHGKSRNGWMSLLGQGLTGIISFSNVPVRFALFLGMLVSIFSVVYAVVIGILTLAGQIDAFPGVPTLICALFFFGGVQLFFLGLIGEYIMAIFNQVRRRPLVVERERINFDAKSLSE
jgi:polyisoprenyl-phosphate glycosyltransferase